MSTTVEDLTRVIVALDLGAKTVVLDEGTKPTVEAAAEFLRRFRCDHPDWRAGR